MNKNGNSLGEGFTLLTEIEAAEVLRQPIGSLGQLNGFPAAVTLGQRRFYLLAEIESYINEQRTNKQ